MGRIVYYGLAVPFSHLPLIVLYGFSGVFYLLLISILPYRKKVITQNLTHSFPNKSEKEIRQLRRKFYRYFADLMVESLKLLGISKKELLQRISVENPELLDTYFQQKKSVILISSHLNNWEFIILAQDLLFEHQAIGIGMPLSNPYWHRKITAKRERYGMVVTDPNSYKETLKSYDKVPTATLILNDQSPSKVANSYWYNFLNRETAFYFGAEIMANQFNQPVIYLKLKKQKRGRYSIELKEITASPRAEEYGKILREYIIQLENDILEKPEYWLWSHKRWKKGVPPNLEEIKKNHEDRFIQNFRKEKIQH